MFQYIVPRAYLGIYKREGKAKVAWHNESFVVEELFIEVLSLHTCPKYEDSLFAKHFGFYVMAIGIAHGHCFLILRRLLVA